MAKRIRPNENPFAAFLCPVCQKEHLANKKTRRSEYEGRWGICCKTCLPTLRAHRKECLKRERARSKRVSELVRPKARTPCAPGDRRDGAFEKQKHLYEVGMIDEPPDGTVIY